MPSERVHPAVTDAEARAHLERLYAQPGAVPSRDADDDAGGLAARIAALRSNPTWVRHPDDDRVRSLDAEIPADADHEALALRIYVPASDPVGTLVFAHGGGWVAGDLDANDALCRALAAIVGVRVLSVDYRLAPEHPFPAPVDDVERALVYALAGAGGLIPDEEPVGIAGHSAGGNLAAAAALRARGGSAVAPGLACQVLLCPVLDDAPGPDADGSYGAFTWGLPLTAQGMRWYWSLYAPDGRARRTPDASPLRAPDLAGSAPAVVVAAQADPLRDEAAAYAARLDAAGVPTTFVERAGVPHLFLTFPGLRSRDEVLAEIAPAVRSALAAATVPGAGAGAGAR